MSMMRRALAPIAFAVCMIVSSPSMAATIGYTEGFDTGVAGWEDSLNGPLTFVASGGADGGGYVSTGFSYLGYENPFGGGPVTFRASFADGASGGAFVGDYLAEGVGGIRVSFRHDAPEPLTLFMRVASQFNFPGAVIAQAVAAPAHVWTEIVFPIDALSPLCTGEAVSCAAALSNVENLQFGTDAPLGLTDDDQLYTLELDRVSILPIPEPGSGLLTLLGLAGLSASGCRPRRAGRAS